MKITERHEVDIEVNSWQVKARQNPDLTWHASLYDYDDSLVSFATFLSKVQMITELLGWIKLNEPFYERKISKHTSFIPNFDWNANDTPLITFHESWSDRVIGVDEDPFEWQKKIDEESWEQLDPEERARLDRIGR